MDEEFPVSVRTVGGRLRVDAVYDGQPANLPGGRLTTVAGTGVATLADRQARLDGAETRYWALAGLARNLSDPVAVARLLDRDRPLDRVSVTVTADGETHELSLARRREPEPTAELDRSAPVPDRSGPRYRLYADGDAALLVPGDLTGYRESLAVMRGRDAGLVADHSERAYE